MQVQMQVQAPIDRLAKIERVSRERAPGRSRPVQRVPRAALCLLTAVAILGAGAASARSTGTLVDPDLARVIRFMALMKGGFALAAFAACLWRLARPAGPWRTPVYVVGPPLMAAGAIGLWSFQGLQVAAPALHLGLFAVLAAALTDPDFLPDLSRLGRGRR